MTNWKRSAFMKLRHLKKMAAIMHKDTYFEDTFWKYVREYADAHLRRVAGHNGHYKREDT